MGDRLPSDHNYRLYSSLIGVSAVLKEIDWQLGTITGIPDRDGWIKLGRESFVMIRCKLEDSKTFMLLDKQVIRVGQNLIQLGESEGESLQIHESLKSRIVTIKSKTCRTDPFSFGLSLGKQLSDINVQSIPLLGNRKTIKVKDTTVIGYGLQFIELDRDESIALQIHGLGGRRKLGAGVFFDTPQT